MKLIPSILKLIGREKLNIVVASELEIKDPDEGELEKVLKANEIPKKPTPPKVHRILDGFWKDTSK